MILAAALHSDTLTLWQFVSIVSIMAFVVVTAARVFGLLGLIYSSAACTIAAMILAIMYAGRS